MKFQEKYGEYIEKGAYIEHPEGWNPLVDVLMETILSHWEKRESTPPFVAQTKEKFGGLRFYVRYQDEAVEQLIRFAEMMSYTICQDCGNKGELREELPWVKTLCDKCYRKELKRIEGNKKKFLKKFLTSSEKLKLTTIYRDEKPYLSGYLMTDIKKALSDDEYESFLKFIRGQTVALTDEGEELVYEWDFERFLQ